MYKDVARKIVAVLFGLFVIATVGYFVADAVQADTTTIDLSATGDEAWKVSINGKEIVDFYEYEYTGEVLNLGASDIEIYRGEGEAKITVSPDFYTVTCNTGTAAETSGTIIITGNEIEFNDNKDSCTGSITKDVHIKRKNISASDITVAPITDKIYTGNAIEPSVTLSYNGQSLTKGTDYTAEYSDNINATADAKITLTGIGNYTGTLTVTFAISEIDTNNFTVTLEKDTYPYNNGGKIEPSVTSVVYNDNGTSTTLVQGKDFSVKYNNNINPGVNTGEVIITGLGDYNGLNLTKNFTIQKTLTSAFTYTIADQMYTGEAITLTANDITVIDPDTREELEAGVDYEISSQSTNIGTVGGYSVYIKGIGAYTGNSGEVKYNIRKAVISSTSDVAIEVETLIYNGTEQTPKVTVTSADGKITYAENTDYKVECSGRTDAGKGSLTITALAGGKLDGTTTTSFTIKPKELTAADGYRLFVPEFKATYIGGEIKAPSVAVYQNDSDAGLKETTDYKISYANNINVGTATVTATGQGNYTGTLNADFTITAASIETATIADMADQTYTGAAIELTPQLRIRLSQNGSELLLSNQKDYTFSYSDNTNAGTATVTATGTGNYIGSVSKTFEIVSKDIAGTKMSFGAVPSQMYTGALITPDVTITYTPVQTRSMTLEKDSDYELSYENNSAVGTATIIITGTGNYTGTFKRTFKITKRTLTSDELTIENLETQYDYTGQVIEPEITISYKGTDGAVITGLVKDRDYELTYTDDVWPGQKTITITGINNFNGIVKANFNVIGNLSNTGATKVVVTIPKQEYTGSAIEPTNDIEVTFDGKRLVQGNEYTVEYVEDSNINVGPAWVKITGSGYYTGTAEESFEIVPKDISGVTETDTDFVIEGIASNYTYTGGQIIPEEIGITYNGVSFTTGEESGIDFRLSYGENTNVGENAGTVTITALNSNFTGELTRTFTIDAYTLSDAGDMANVAIDGIVPNVLWEELNAEDADLDALGVVLLDDTESASGKAIEMKELQVSCTGLNVDQGGIQLQEKTEEGAGDYIVSYANNTTIGTATITIEGTGNYAGTIIKTFGIRGTLSSASIADIEDWEYRPSLGASVNTPSPVVTYQCGNETLTLTEGTDYTVSYENNENVGTAVAVITAVQDGSYDSNLNAVEDYTDNTNSKTFNIVPCDLTTARDDFDIIIGSPLEEGYEYTGSPIIPDITISCNGVELIRQTAGSAESAYDFSVTAVNNVNVPKLVSDDPGELGLVGDISILPQVIVEAKYETDEEGNPVTDEDGNTVYTGNYKGKIVTPFGINPRNLSEGDVLGVVTLEGQDAEGNYQCDYTGEDITFTAGTEDDELKVLYGTEFVPVTQESGGEQKTNYTVNYADNRAIGKAVITVTGQDNYTGIVTKEFAIMGNLETGSGEDGYLRISYQEEVPYGVEAVYPEVIIEDITGITEENTEPKILELGTDFEFVLEDENGGATCQNNINVAASDSENPPTFVIRGMGCYRGSYSGTYTITPMNLSEDTENYVTAVFSGPGLVEGTDDTFTYNGEPVIPEVTAMNRGHVMTLGVDYTIGEYGNNENVPAEDAAEEELPYVVINAVENGNYIGSKKVYFKIAPRTVADMEIEFTDDVTGLVFDGTKKTPAIEVYYMNNLGERTPLPMEGNYEVSYSDNTNASGTPTVIVSGINNYGGTLEKTFTILPQSIGTDNEEVIVTPGKGYYTGANVTVEIKIAKSDGTKLVQDTDFIVQDATNIDAGTGTVTVAGIGNYTGSREVEFEILQKDITNAVEITGIKNYTYTGEEIFQESMVVTLISDEGKTTNVTLVKDRDYDAKYVRNINAGTAAITITGKGNYTGTATAQFTINKRIIGENGTPEAGLRVDAIEDQLYTGSAILPAVNVTYTNDAGTDIALTAGKDYRLSYSSNKAVGNATITITGINNYTGTIKTTFRIIGDLSLAEVEEIPVQNYTGESIMPEPKVTMGGKTLEKDVDYVLYHDNNLEKGTANLTIEAQMGQDWYIGEKTVQFEIAQVFSDDFSVEGVAESYTYTGEEIIPTIMVRDGDSILTADVDYNMKCTDNINAGMATMTIEGTGEYSGTRTINFRILPQSIAMSSVSGVSDQPYTGERIQPEVTVENNGTALTAGTDYITVYVNDGKPGKASVIVKGRGNYTGTKTLNYNITVSAVSGFDVRKVGTNSIIFAWNGESIVNGYEIYDSGNKLVARVRNSRNTYAVDGLEPGSTYSYKIRTYVIKDGQYCYSPFQSIQAATKGN